MPTNSADYLDKFGLIGGGILFIWAIHTGRLYLPREVDFLKNTYEKRISDLLARLQSAENELSSQRLLMNKVVDHALSERNTDP